MKKDYKFEKEYRIKNSAIGFINRLTEKTIERSITSKEHQDEWLKYKNDYLTPLPNYKTEYLRGYYRSATDNMVKNNIRFFYLINNCLYGIDPKKPDYYEKVFTPEFICQGAHVNGFFWEKTGKPWFIGKRERVEHEN